MRTACIALLTIAVTGCSIFRRPPNTFYALDTIPPATAARSVSGSPVGIDGIELPPGIDRRGIVIRKEDNELEVRGTNQWASPLEDMVIHTLSFNLASRLPEGMVVLPGQLKPAAMRSIFIMFEELAPGPDQVFVLDARWTLTTGGTMRTGHERITINMPSMKSEDIVTAMNQALAEFADRLAAAL